jgi:Ni/Co efflux regulator RcnB
MRVLVAIAAVLATSLAMALPADARQQKKARSHDQQASQAKRSDYYAKRAREEANECARAESLDPAGDYKGYPCWARAALAPKGIFER